MGVSTLTAARIFKGQQMGYTGEEYHLAWDDFPAIALAKVVIWAVEAYIVIFFNNY